MVNQWGRDGRSPSGGSGSSGLGVIIAAVVALVIGAGGGYVGARVLGGTSAADLAARDQKITELTETLADLKFDSQGADSQQGNLRKRIGELDSQVKKLQQAVQTAKSRADVEIAKARQDADAEIVALKSTLDDAGQAADQLRRAQKSLKVSELQIIELENKSRDQSAQIGRLQAAIKQAAGQTGPELERLRNENRDLKSRLTEAGKTAARIAGLQAEISQLKAQLEQRAENADSEARKQIAALQSERAALTAKLAAAVKAAAGSEAQGERLAALQARFDEVSSQLADRDNAANAARAQLKATTAELVSAQSEIATFRDQNRALTGERERLKSSVTALRADVTRLQAEIKASQNRSTQDDTGQDGLGRENTGNAEQPADAGDEQPPTEPSRRDRSAVERAVAELPGFDRLAPEKRNALIDMLERGDCVTDSLKAAFGKVSPIALRSLFRDLGGGC